MIKLITCDIDGTLLQNFLDSINPKLFELIKKFKEKGVLFFPASGRQLFNLKKIFEPVKNEIGYISENGALVIHNDKLLYEAKLEKDLAKQIATKIIEKDGVELFVCCPETTFLVTDINKIDKKLLDEFLEEIEIVPEFESIKEDILKLSIFSKDGITNEIIQEFSDQFGNQVHHTVSGHKWYDFMKLDTHKGNAIKFLQNNLGITSDETVSFGDNFNDIEMLREAKYSYAMKNAHKEVKDVANYICDDVINTLEDLYNKFFGEVQND